MKKYIKPSVEIIEVETQSILQASMDKSQTVVNSSLAPGRRNRNNDIWDDDEDWD